MHLKAIERTIDELFSEQIERRELTKGEKILPAVIGIKGVEYVFKHIDTRNPEKLKELADKMLSDFLKEHPDNTTELFIENEITRAKDFQTYFPKYRTDNVQKEYYFKLQRWIDCLKKINGFSESKWTGDYDGIKKYNSLKEIFISEAAYIECTNALRKTTPPIISGENRYLLGPRQKGAFAAWYEIVKLRQKIKPGIISADVAKLLNKEIVGLNFGQDGTTLRRTGTTMYKKYNTAFSKLIL